MKACMSTAQLTFSTLIHSTTNASHNGFGLCKSINAIKTLPCSKPY